MNFFGRISGSYVEKLYYGENGEKLQQQNFLLLSFKKTYFEKKTFFLINSNMSTNDILKRLKYLWINAWRIPKKRNHYKSGGVNIQVMWHWWGSNRLCSQKLSKFFLTYVKKKIKNLQTTYYLKNFYNEDQLIYNNNNIRRSGKNTDQVS